LNSDWTSEPETETETETEKRSINLEDIMNKTDGIDENDEDPFIIDKTKPINMISMRKKVKYKLSMFH